jgi:hypothetical protein
MTGEKNFEDYRRENNGITWKDYVDLRFAEVDKALRIYTTEMNRRLEGMNEIRSQLDRQAATFQTKDASALITDRVEEKIAAVQISAAGEAAKTKLYALFTAALISIVIGLTVYFITRG